MPYSSTYGKEEIKRIVSAVKHEKMLDIGCGAGTYAKLFPNAEWTGVEVWEPYVEQFRLQDLYQTLIIGDAREWQPFDHYDVAFAGDVLEHMTYDEAKTLIGKLQGCADVVIASIPIGHWPQEEWEGNPYEKHVKDNWTDDEARSLFNAQVRGSVQGGIGVYAWSKDWADKLGNFRDSLKIAVYAIAKNEEKHVQRFCESAKDADYVVIADTGSTDKTIEIARECGASVYSIKIDPWRFDHARNASLALVPQDADICISLDLDEVLEPGWRDVVSRLWEPGTGRMRYKMDVGSGHLFYAEKIHARSNYFWRYPIHEYIVPTKPEKFIEYHGVLTTHKPDTDKSRGQYLHLLQKATEEDPRCQRMAYYYTRELYYHAKWEEVIVEANRYLNMPDALTAHERVHAMRILGKAHKALDRGGEAQKWFRKACAELPTIREPWCDLAQACYEWGLWLESYYCAMQALHITDRAFLHTSDPACWGAWPHDLASIAAWNMGFKDISRVQARLAAEKDPGNERLQNNLRIVQEAS